MGVPDNIRDAAISGDVDTLRAYFESEERDPNAIHEASGWTLLDAAARGSRDRDVISVETLRFLIQQGAEVNYQEPGGVVHTPLAIAAFGCSKHGTNAPEAIQLLVENGADVNAETGPGTPPGFSAIFRAAISNDMETFSFLLKSGAILDSGLEARRTASRERMGGETIEDWINIHINEQPGYNSQIAKYRFRLLTRLLADFRAAGGTVPAYLWAPRKNLCVLRLLCEQGRATPLLGPIGLQTRWDKRVVDSAERAFLERLFAWSPPYATDSRRRTRSSQAAVRASHNPLPRDVFKLVLSFWRSKRDYGWVYEGYDYW